MASPKLLDQVRTVARVRHFSLKTEKAYAQWIKRFILFHKKRHPIDMAEPEIACEGYRFLREPVDDSGWEGRERSSNHAAAKDSTCIARATTQIKGASPTRSQRGFRSGLPSVRSRKKVSERGSRMGLAIRISCCEALARSAHRN